jgi:predicted nuclease of predicted toxin-antitoxin system
MLKLFIDEDVPEAVALALRLRGYDVTTAKEAGRKGLADVEQLQHATSQKRVFLTHNVADFCAIHADFCRTGLQHGGIILCKQLSIGTITKALLRFLSSPSSQSVTNKVVWLTDWIK